MQTLALIHKLQTGINWEKLKCCHSLIDATDMLPPSEVPHSPSLLPWLLIMLVLMLTLLTPGQTLS